MKKLLPIIFTACALYFSSCFATEIDYQIAAELNKKTENEISSKTKELNEKITFTQANSCESMDKVLGDFLETYKKLHPQRKEYFRDEIYKSINSFAVDDTVVYDGADFNAMTETSAGIDRGVISSDFSTTNIQKVGVDEPEILKSNGEYLFYYSRESYKDSYISIIKAPTKDDLSDAEVVKKISIPESLRNVELFLNGSKLVIIASRYNYKGDDILGNDRSIIIIYDISNLDNLVLEKMTEIYGNYQDARMIKDQIYLISSINLNWYDIAWNRKNIDFSALIPNLTDIYLKKSSNNTKRTYQRKTLATPCNNIFYLMPSEDTMKESGIYPNFTLISQVSISDTASATKQSLVFGTTDEIHMSNNSLYLPSELYISEPVKCGFRGCLSYWSYRGTNTLIHKFNLGDNLKYQDSTIIAGSPLNQYSMDEDSDGNFRILTTTRYNQQATHLFILNDKLDLIGNLINIEPGENFKSSRYIGDKLYLVTYQTIDPLFVVDLQDNKNPKIIGELKIPGYSTYLHPYDTAKDGVQYLIGLGYSTTDNGYGGLKTDNVKVDLYKIDYNENETAETKCSSLITKNVDKNQTNSCLSSAYPCNQEQLIYESCLSKVNPENIAVSLVTSHEFTGDSSESPALYNPRTFVWRNSKKELILPIGIKELIEEGTRENNRRYKYNTFMGIKGLSIDSSKESIKEFLSNNYYKEKDDFDYDYYYYWNFNNARVGYINDTYYFLNNGITSFIKGSNSINI